jgi:ABC-2 type transport system permease protein
VTDLFTLLSPAIWSLKNDVARFNRAFYWKAFLYFFSGAGFILVITRLLSAGMAELQGLSPDVFTVLLVKGYSLIFMLLFFMQVISGLIISLGAFYQSKDLDLLFTSPVSRTSLFFSRLIETQTRSSWMPVLFGMPLLVSAGLLYHAPFLYYLLAVPLFIAFSVIPVSIGAGAAIFLATFLDVRRLRKFLISSGVIMVILLVTILRIFRPERFVNPELFANLTLFVSELKTPAFVLLPNRWMSDSIFHFLAGNMTGATLIQSALLFLTAYVMTVFLEVLFKRYHYKGWGLMQEGVIAGKRPGRSLDAAGALRETGMPLLGRILKIFDVRSRAFIRKDLLYQARDPRNIQQTLILFSLLIVYIFSIASLPLNWEHYALRLKYAVSFLDLGLILFIMASLCARVVHPSIAEEGLSMWMVRTSPVTPKRFIWTKYLFYSIPLFVTGLLLTILTSRLIGIEKALAALKGATVFLLGSSFVSLALSFGISDMRQSAATSQEKTKTSSTPFMLASVALIFLTLALEIIPVFLYFLREAKKGAFTRAAWGAIGGMISVLFLSNIIVTVLSIRRSIKKLENAEPG